MINQDIVTKRQSLVPKLDEMENKIKSYTLTLSSLGGILHNLETVSPIKIMEVQEKLAKIENKIKLLHKKFSSGTVTVAIAGLEKSGKTTLLKTLTGIEELPTYTSRCTAVCCEINYSPDQRDFTLSFYSEEEFLQKVIINSIETINSLSQTSIPKPSSIDQFIGSDFRSWSEDNKIRKNHIAITLSKDLLSIQKHLPTHRSLLGSNNQTKGIEELTSWVARPETGDESLSTKISTVKRCIINSSFEGGSENLRWIDTPGVDDPNPKARRLALSAIAEDADLLIVATMPETKPTPTQSFVDFWNSINNYESDIDLLDRMYIALNWNSQSDPNAENIKKHQEEIIYTYDVTRSQFIGPYQAVSKDDAKRLMRTINSHFDEKLLDQDKKVISILKKEFSSLEADIRLHIFDSLRKETPQDGSFADDLQDALDKWFKVKSEDGGLKSGFWPRLREAFTQTTSNIQSLPLIANAQKELNESFLSDYKEALGGIRARAI
jgi:GTPase Era involved in 16S rRNA processing